MSSSTNDYCGKHDTLYYQTQPDNYNQRQQYPRDITTQQDHYITDYDKENVGKCGVAYIVIPSPDIKQLPTISLVDVPYYRKKNPIIYSCTSLKTETSKMHQLKSQPKLQSK